MAQQLKALAALPENPGSIPSPHMLTSNYLCLQFQVMGYSLLASEGTEHKCGVDIRVHQTLIEIQ